MNARQRQLAKRLEVIALIRGWSILSDDQYDLVAALVEERAAAKRLREAKKNARIAVGR